MAGGAGGHLLGLLMTGLAGSHGRTIGRLKSFVMDHVPMAVGAVKAHFQMSVMGDIDF